MSGAFAMPHSLTSGAGYKANGTYDEFLRKHSGFYRKHSAAGQALEEDRRRSSVINNDAAEAVANVEAQNARKGSIASASGGAATTIGRKGSVVVASSADRKDSIFGMESSAGVQMDPNRRPSTSLASDIMYKLKDRK
jgi:hypothetical protein